MISFATQIWFSGQNKITSVEPDFKAHNTAKDLIEWNMSGCFMLGQMNNNTKSSCNLWKPIAIIKIKRLFKSY